MAHMNGYLDGVSGYIRIMMDAASWAPWEYAETPSKGLSVAIKASRPSRAL